MDAMHAHLVGFGVFVTLTACMGVLLWAVWSLALQAYDGWCGGPTP